MRSSSPLLPRPAVPALVGAVMLTLAMPIAIWWLVGDLSTTTTSPDYLFHPLRVSPMTERAVGRSALGLASVGAGILVLCVLRHRFDGRWWMVLAPIALAGALSGSAWRVMTAGVIGANIGGGIALMFGPLIVVALLSVAASRWVTFRRLRPNAHPAAASDSG